MSNLCKCLVGTVALRGICEERELCVNYLNDIPGISHQAFAYLRDVENQTAKEVFKRVETNGIERLYYDLLARSPFRKKKKAKKHITGKFKKPCVSVPSESCLRGFVINLFESDYLEATLQGFSIHTETATLATDFLYVFDLETGELLDQIEFQTDGVGNYKFDVSGKSYGSCERLFIAYDAANIESCETERKKSNTCLPDCLACGCGAGNAFYKYCYDGDVLQALPCFDELERDDSGGLILEYKISCCFAKWLCECKEELAPILRLAMGIQFFEEINGMIGKLNKLTLMPEETKTAIQDSLKDQYEVAIYEFLKGLNPDCCCFECNPKITKRQILP